MAVTFGTSGLRGPAVGFTDAACIAYVIAFLRHISRDFEFNDVFVAADLRGSSLESPLRA